MLRNSLFAICLMGIWTVTACSNDDSGTCDTENDTDNSFISNVSVSINSEVHTVLVVTWTQDVEADQVWLRYTFENDEWYESSPMSGEAGEREEVVLGVPGETEVTIRVVSKSGDVENESEDILGTTGEIPDGMPYINIEQYDASIASPNRWMLGSVEAGEHYAGPFWIFIVDRQGRIVWYYSDLGQNPIIGFPRVSRDGRYIFFGNRMWSEIPPSATKMTLDHDYFEILDLPISDNLDMTDDGSLLFNTNDEGYGASWLVEYLPDGTYRNIWDCSAVFGTDCYSNTINWNPLDDTILWSNPYLNTVVEIDRQTGDIVGQYGEYPGSYSFDNDLWIFDFQHYANISPEGTLMVSSHVQNTGAMHAFMEFEIDRDNQMLIEKWIYREGDEWADAMGEVHRIPNGNGNVLANYGTGGVIREITPDKRTAWYVNWFVPDGFTQLNRMVGHCTMIDDLYALNQGPE